MNLYNIDYHLVEEVELGVSINPISFLVVQQDKVKLLPINHSSCIDKILDYIPEVMEKIEGMVNSNENKDKDEEKNNNKKQKKTDKDFTNIPRKKAKLSKIPKTTTEELEKKKGNIPESEDAIKELEDIFEQEYEYEDDDE